jgi:hypothetical protein
MLQRRTAPVRCRQTRHAGPTAKRRAAKARRTFRAEQAVKRRVLALDGHHCRWPHCEVPPSAYWGGLECAHFRASGMGGRPSMGTEQNLIAMCETHHRGPRGLHSPYARMTPRDEALGMRGVVVFERRDTREGDWIVVGETAPPNSSGLCNGN